MDFTIITYKSLLQSLLSKGYEFITYQDYSNPDIKLNDRPYTILRHDVDRLPSNSLRTAKIEHSLGIRGTYYFRMVRASYDEIIIKKIASLGHEVGYHYEDVHFVLRNKKVKIKNDEGQIDIERLTDLAYESFCSNLEKLKKIANVQTICMHGSPLSKFDNKIIWKKYDYRELDILGEPYLDLDWSKFLYLTDTGRKWNGEDVSVRDKVSSKYNFNFKSTKDIIDNIENLPPHLMITIHPQRWDDNIINWLKELLAQSGKNVIKKYLLNRETVFGFN